MSYDAPGFADTLTGDLLEQWNQVIQRNYDSLSPDLGSRFFSLDPQALADVQPAEVEWFGSPAEPQFCLGDTVAQQLSDWGVRGRQVLHNEYCEYKVIEQADATGRMRPKRVHVTTELREYWVTLAVHAPDVLRGLVKDVLGIEVGWEDLYGVSDPAALSPEQREIRFSTFVAGNGNDSGLPQTVPAQPIGRLNTDHALFMTHPINGLDDLLYIVMFGAKPYAVRSASGQPLDQATREQIFRAFQVEHLACRHADPAAAMGAYGAAFQGAAVAFANPLGMYIKTFNVDVFSYNGDAVPQEWIRFRRGSGDGLYQRLEFGPGDDNPAFLDDVKVAVGMDDVPLTGGYQVVQNIEVGPRVVVGAPSPVKPDEHVILETSADPIRCVEAEVCQRIRELKAQYDQAHQMAVVAPRTMGIRN
jgi:hypothetical protein